MSATSPTSTRHAPDGAMPASTTPLADGPLPAEAPEVVVVSPTAAVVTEAASTTAVESPVVYVGSEPLDQMQERRAEIKAEYGMYRAITPIYVGNALAYNVGDPVPRSNAESQDMVALGLVERLPDPKAQGAAPSPSPTSSPSLLPTGLPPA